MKIRNRDISHGMHGGYFYPLTLRLLLCVLTKVCLSSPLMAQANNTGNLYIAGNVYLNSDFANTTSTAKYQNDSNFKLTGNFTNDQPSMIQGSGTTLFVGSSLQKISGTQAPVFHNVSLNNPGGVQMNINTTIGGLISTVSGSLYFNDHALTMGGKINTAYTNTSAFSVTALSDLNITGLAADGNNLYFASSGNTLHNLTVSSGATGVLGNALNITAGSLFGTVTVNGNFDAAGYLTLKSDAAGTARIGLSAGILTGNTTVERFIPARRAWRFLTVPFDSSTQSINQAWQEGYSNANLNCPPQYPGTPGFGTEITYNGINGYDLNTTQNPSIKVWQNNAWAPISSTLIPKITDYSSYCLYVRGDRMICLIESTNAIPDNTILRPTGTLNQKGGVNTVIKNYNGVAGDFFFTGNPYASSVNLQNVINGSRVNGFDPGKIWVWDPKLSGLYGDGAYVAYSNGMWVPSGGSYPSGTSNLPIIQNGQAFMVQTNSPTASVSFQESDKTVPETNVFGRAMNQQYAVIYTDLLQQDSTDLLDGVAAGFANRFSSSVDADDAEKQWNNKESLALVRGEKTLAIEFRSVPTFTDTLFFRLYLKQEPYTLKIFSQNITPGLPASAWIVDKYLDSQTEIDLYDTTLYNFTPNPDTNSYRNRFMLVFDRTDGKEVNNKESITGNQVEANALIYPNPVSGKSFNLILHDLENEEYTINIYTATGRLIVTHSIYGRKSNTEYLVKLPPYITAGNYTVKVFSSGGKIISTIPIIVGK